MIALLPLAFALSCTSPRVIDGDTLVCDGRHVRLFGMDAPEVDHGRSRPAQPFAYTATWRLRELVSGAAVTCTPAGNRIDRYGRTVAICATAGAPDLGALLVREGLAVDYPRYSGGRYAPLQHAAEAAHRGLWSGSDKP